jgi:hypothetical protein
MGTLMGNLLLFLFLGAFLPQAGTSQTTDAEPSKRFFERMRILGVELERGEVTVVDSEGKSRTWKEGDRVHEEEAVLKEVTRAHLVFTRIVEGVNGVKGESLVVVRFDSSGGVKVREYSSVSDAPRPTAPPHERLQ